MPKPEHDHPFIRHLVRNDIIINQAVNATLTSEQPSNIVRKFIDLDKLKAEGPEWIKPHAQELSEFLFGLNTTEFWREMIKGSGFHPLVLAEEGLISKSAARSVNLAAEDIRINSANGMDFILPAFGLAAIAGENIDSYLRNSAGRSPVTLSARVAGRFVGQSQDIEDFVVRMLLFFPTTFDNPDDKSAWFFLNRYNAFTGKDDKICPAIGLTRKILLAYGHEFEQALSQESVSANSSDF